MNIFAASDSKLDRRSMIRRVAHSLLGVSALGSPSTLSAAPIASKLADKAETPGVPTPGTAKTVIYIYLWGGLSQIDTFDPKPGTQTQGPVEALDTNADGIQISEYFPNMARQMDKVCAVRSMNTTQGEHQQGSYFMRTSYVMNQTTSHPGLGAWGSHLLGAHNPGLPANIRIGGHHGNRFWGGFLDPRHSAMPIVDAEEGLRNGSISDSVAKGRLDRRLERVQQMNEEFVQAKSTRATRSHVELFDEAIKLMNSKEINSFNLNLESKQKREQYGLNSLGQGCLLAKRLASSGVRFIEVNDRDWDTHVRNFPKLEEKGPILDQALAALLSDLQSSGMLNDTLVVVGTEFGRTPTIDKKHMGRGHYPNAFTCLLAGGGIAGGRAYGATDADGREIIEDAVSIPDFNATIAHAMGLPLDKKTISPTGRPFTVANTGKPIYSLFG